ncbi:hypothetical protein ASPCAL04201 [Aspergillus calidoustus]|uniref:Uncharacterized protein n=1 Tax=Aspergillus calidoustus TaxID=454130 RepID=A0A0U5FUN9_ASPCI|nr:hypothetical protein ASPCAL04201 [Aspergillus calidoustus]
MPEAITQPSSNGGKDQPWKLFWPPTASADTNTDTNTGADEKPWLNWKPDPNKPDEKPWIQWVNDEKFNGARGRQQERKRSGGGDAALRIPCPRGTVAEGG